MSTSATFLCLPDAMREEVAAVRERVAVVRDVTSLSDDSLSIVFAYSSGHSPQETVGSVLKDPNKRVRKEELVRTALDITAAYQSTEQFDRMIVWADVGLCVLGARKLGDCEVLENEDVPTSRFRVAMAKGRFGLAILGQDEFKSARARYVQMKVLADTLMFRYRRQYLEGAESCYRFALEMDMKVHGPTHARVAESLMNLANVLMKAGRSAESFELHKRSLRIKQRMIPPNERSIAVSHCNMAICLDTMSNREDQALETIDTALRLYESVAADADPEFHKFNDDQCLKAMRRHRQRMLKRKERKERKEKRVAL